MDPSMEQGAGQTEGFWTEGRFRAAAVAGTVLVFLVLFWVRFDYDPPPPRMPTRPPPGPRADELARLNYSQGMYKATLEKHARDYGVSIDADALTSPFPSEAVDIGQELEPGAAPIETATLRLSARTDRLDVTTNRGSFRDEFLILKIENKTDRYLAYRVDTSAGAPQRCMSKGDIAHNALALAPGESVERTECFWRSGMKLAVKRVETITLPALSYFYVSRLYPPHIGLDNRATRGHRAPKGQVCPDIPEQTIRRGMQGGTVTWRDVIDFYARHDCATYIFPPGYKAFDKKDQYPLPVSREAALVPPQ